MNLGVAMERQAQLVEQQEDLAAINNNAIYLVPEEPNRDLTCEDAASAYFKIDLEPAL